MSDVRSAADDPQPLPTMGDGRDMVNSPGHYRGTGGLEVIDVIEAFGLDGNFCRANAAKYLLRAGKKGDVIEDLEKCLWYIRRDIERMKGPIQLNGKPSRII